MEFTLTIGSDVLSWGLLLAIKICGFWSVWHNMPSEAGGFLLYY